MELYVAALSRFTHIDCSTRTSLSLFGTGCMEDKQKVLDDSFLRRPCMTL